MNVVNSEIPWYSKSMNDNFLEFKKSKTKSYQDENGQVCCIQQAKQKSNVLIVLFLLALFWHSVHIPRCKSCPSSAFLRSCPQSESLKLMERGHEVGRVGSLGSAQEPHQTHTEHMEIYTPALHKSPPGLLGFPKSCYSQCLQKTPLQILRFHQQQNLLCFLSSLILGRGWTEICLLESSWWEQQARSTAAAKRSAQTPVPQHSSFQPNHPRE